MGHASMDVLPGGFRVGGTVTYAGLLGIRLGVPTGIITSYAPGLPVQDTLAGAALHVRESAHSTTFQNIYDGSHRRQFTSAQAETLQQKDVPPTWRGAPVVLLGPVARELDLDLFGAFPDSLLALTPQGMMRGWNDAGEVFAVDWDPPGSTLAQLDVMVLSEDDLVDSSQLESYKQLVGIVAVTHAEEGATVYLDGQGTYYPACPAHPVDPTGAGDIFAAAFVLELQRSGDVASAARFANAAASIVIEHEGPSGVPDRGQVLERLRLATSNR